MNYIEEDLRWFEMGIPGMVLVWETECFLAKWVSDHEKFDLWLERNRDGL
jgi:hypothetical protein